jgi:imidazolonepropionase-like amidohydrolase
VSSSVDPGNQYLQRAVAGGVTVVLYIPGSGTNMSGWGVLLKTPRMLYEEALIRDPGSLKVAQAVNPERWAMGVGRSFMNWNLRNTFRRGVAYAKAWEASERGEGEAPPPPRIDVQWEIFRHLVAKRAAVSAHTQIYQIVLMTLTMIRQEFGLDVFIDHGTFDSWRTAALAEELDVPAILGPRSISRQYVGFYAEIDTDGRFEGVAARFQSEGHTAIGFNTDAINPSFGSGPSTEELPLQAAMGVRWGMTNQRLEALRGLTIVPAMAASIEDRVGSLEVGKDADLVISGGDPTDPRNRIRRVYVEGRLVHDREDDRTVW